MEYPVKLKDLGAMSVKLVSGSDVIVENVIHGYPPTKFGDRMILDRFTCLNLTDFDDDTIYNKNHLIECIDNAMCVAYLKLSNIISEHVLGEYEKYEYTLPKYSNGYTSKNSHINIYSPSPLEVYLGRKIVELLDIDKSSLFKYSFDWYRVRIMSGPFEHL